MPEKKVSKILRCWPAFRKKPLCFRERSRAMRSACDSDSRCGLACDASARDANSLVMWVERCEPLRCGRFGQGPLNGGGFKRGGFPDLDSSFLFCPFLSFFVLFCPFLGLSRFFLDFPDLPADGPGIFPICPFPLSRPIKSTYEEQSRKGPRHNLDLSRKKWETPGFGNPFSFSQFGGQLAGSQKEIDPWQIWSLKMLQNDSSRPQPQHRIEYLDLWVHDFYPVS